jgi:hypothetical protein
MCEGATEEVLHSLHKSLYNILSPRTCISLNRRERENLGVGHARGMATYELPHNIRIIRPVLMLALLVEITDTILNQMGFDLYAARSAARPSPSKR